MMLRFVGRRLLPSLFFGTTLVVLDVVKARGPPKMIVAGSANTLTAEELFAAMQKDISSWQSQATANEAKLQQDVSTNMETFDALAKEQALNHELAVTRILDQEAEALISAEQYCTELVLQNEATGVNKCEMEKAAVRDKYDNLLVLQEALFSTDFANLMNQYKVVLTNLGLAGHVLIDIITRIYIAGIQTMASSYPDFDQVYFQGKIDELKAISDSILLLINESIMPEMASMDTVQVGQVCMELVGMEREFTEAEQMQFKQLFAVTMETTKAEQGHDAEVLYVTISQQLVEGIGSDGLRRMLRHGGRRESRSRHQDFLVRKLKHNRTLRMKASTAYRCRDNTDNLESDVYRRLLLNKDEGLKEDPSSSSLATTAAATTTTTGTEGDNHHLDALIESWKQGKLNLNYDHHHLPEAAPPLLAEEQEWKLQIEQEQQLQQRNLGKPAGKGGIRIYQAGQSVEEETQIEIVEGVSAFDTLLAKNLQMNTVSMFDTPIEVNAILCHEAF